MPDSISIEETSHTETKLALALGPDEFFELIIGTVEGQLEYCVLGARSGASYFPYSLSPNQVEALCELLDHAKFNDLF